MSPTPHDHVDQDRMRDFIKGLQQEHIEGDRKAVETTAAILLGAAAWRGYKNYRRGRG